MKMTKTLAKKVLETVDAGLCNGIGKPELGKMCIEAAVCFAMGLPHSDNPPCVSSAVRRLKITLNDSGWSSDIARAKGMRRLAISQLGTNENFNDIEFSKKISKLCIIKTVPKALRSAASIHPDKKHKDALEQAALRCENEGTQAASWAASWAASEAARAASWAASWAASEAARAASEAARAASEAARAASEAASWAASEAASWAARAASWAARAASEEKPNAADMELSEFAEQVVQILIDMKAEGTQWLDLTE